MVIKSPVFEKNGMLLNTYTCDGRNINPPLLFENVPSGVGSLVLIVDDPDAPSKTWVHWTVFNINPQIREIKEDSVPEGAVLGMTDFGKPGYGGPCPPTGIHRYFFKLYALDSTLNLSEGATKEKVEKAMEGHILDSTELIGLYSRS